MVEEGILRIRERTQWQRFIAWPLIAFGICGVLLSMVVKPSAEQTPIAQAQAPTQCSKADVMVVLDRSGSMTERTGQQHTGITRIESAKRAIRNMLTFYDERNNNPSNDPNAKTRVGLVSFSDSATLNAGLSSDSGFTTTRTALDGVTPFGETAIGSGIQMARDELIQNARTGAAKVIVVISDGENNRGVDPLQVATSAKQAGITIFSVSIDVVGVMPQIAGAIPSDPTKTYWFNDPDGSQLDLIFTTIAGQACKIVVPPPGPIPTVRSFTVSTQLIQAEEGEVTVRWDVENYTDVYLSCDWAGDNNDGWFSCPQWTHYSKDGVGGIPKNPGQITVTIHSTYLWLLLACNQNGCTNIKVSPTVVVKPPETLRFCVSSQGVPISNVEIKVQPINPPNNNPSYIIKSPPAPNTDHIYTHALTADGKKGCTEITEINYAHLVKGEKYVLVALKDGYGVRSQVFTRKGNSQTIQIALFINSFDNRGIRFCTFDDRNQNLPKETWKPLGGAHIQPPTILTFGPEDIYQIYTSPIDGCSNNDLLDLDRFERDMAAREALIKQNPNTPPLTYHLKVELDGYETLETEWQPKRKGEVPDQNGQYAAEDVKLFLHADSGKVTNITKTADPSVLKSKLDTEVTIKFQVKTYNLDDFVLEEKLAQNLKFVVKPAPENFKPTLTLLTDSDGRTVNQNLVIPNTPDFTYNDNSFHLAYPKMNVGTYQMKFRVAYTGGLGDNLPIDEIVELASGGCNGPGKPVTGRSHFEWTSTFGRQCATVPPGRISRAEGKVILTDAFIGDRSALVKSGKFSVSDNAFILTGGGSEVQAPFQVTNYTRPSTGGLTWDKLAQEMQRRVDRSIKSGQAKIVEVDCTQPITGRLFLNSDRNTPFEPIAADRNGKPGVWVLSKRGGNPSDRCDILLQGITFSGTGTLVVAGEDSTVVVADGIHPVDPNKKPKESIGLMVPKGNLRIKQGSEIQNAAVFVGKEATVYTP